MDTNVIGLDIAKQVFHLYTIGAGGKVNRIYLAGCHYVRINYEFLMAISGYARGGTYVLFAKRNGKWIQFSDGIEQAHHISH